MHLLTKFNIYLIAFFLNFLFLNNSSASGDDKDIRIISISPAATEIIYAIGAGDSLVAVSSYCNWPPEAKAKTKIGSFSWPKIEKIIYLQPDIVITAGLEQAPVVQQLKALNIRTIVCSAKTIEGLFGAIEEIALAVDRIEEGQKLIKVMSARINQIKSRFEDIPVNKRPKVLLELWDEPLIVAGTDSLIGQVIELAGGKNIAYDAMHAYSRFSYELVLKRNPDYIIAVYMKRGQDKERIKNRFGYSNIKAVKNDHIICDINPDIILRAGPRITEAIDEINKRIYAQ
ncbi:MAG: cobalamin-binding protein [Candidatus Omnitrophica bacterium]|nr:cobalamin-binding protein [Candidatus Omnitrophota bacterium]